MIYNQTIPHDIKPLVSCTLAVIKEASLQRYGQYFLLLIIGGVQENDARVVTIVRCLTASSQLATIDSYRQVHDIYVSTIVREER